MFENVLGASLILLGVLWFVFKYGVTREIDGKFIIPDIDKYEIIEEEKFLKIQKRKYIFIGSIWLGIGIITLCFSPMFIILSMLTFSMEASFTNKGKKYVREKY